MAKGLVPAIAIHKALGHPDIMTMMIYIHVAKPLIQEQV